MVRCGHKSFPVEIQRRQIIRRENYDEGANDSSQHLSNQMWINIHIHQSDGERGRQRAWKYSRGWKEWHFTLSSFLLPSIMWDALNKRLTDDTWAGVQISNQIQDNLRRCICSGGWVMTLSLHCSTELMDTFCNETPVSFERLRFPVEMIAQDEKKRWNRRLKINCYFITRVGRRKAWLQRFVFQLKSTHFA